MVGSSSQHVPDRGDIISVDFSPRSGREQAGRRPALVLSPAEYNDKVGRCICCPITSKTKGYPFEVDIQRVPGVTGTILADQVSSIDWQVRKASRVSRVPNLILEKVVAKINDLI
ncbi:MAG: endoribonuclease MazF [Candidatus Eremiobacteraeota bacterium]|nr:endoribonuclease MazF [Candidatus Eremiobacteraeota bacterium]MBC5827498.1 endoribonuclease MazF [Candidatus Eremiobacteraeota bacterium]